MRLREYLSFAKRERNGVITLTLLILLVSFMHRFFPSGAIRYTPAGDKPAREDLVSGNKRPDAADDIDNKRARRRRIDFMETGSAGNPVRLGKPGYPGYPEKDISSSDTASALPLFAFDPNTLSADQWKKLGLRDRVIATIQRYTAKGGKFYTPQDLGKIYGLSKAEYERLAPYAVIRKPPLATRRKEERLTLPYNRKLSLATWQKEQRITLLDNRNGHIGRVSDRDSGTSGHASWPADSETEAKASAPGAPGMDNREIIGLKEKRGKDPGGEAGYIIDINRADTGLLQRLPGIGGVLATRIVMFRKKLGGFSSLSQLCEVYGLSEEVYRGLAGRLTCDSGLIKKININAEELYPLRSHPYTKGNIAQTIISYREQHGLFDSIKELKKINSITPEALEKMLPYLSVR